MTLLMIVCLLLAITIEKGSGYIHGKPIAEREVGRIIRHRYVREIINDWDFAVGILVDEPASEPALLSIEIVGSGSNNITRRCLMPRGEFWNVPAPSMTKPRIKRLSDKSILVVIEEYNYHDQAMQPRLYLLNTLNCKYDYVYERALTPKAHFIFTSNQNASDERFVVVMYGKEYCNGHDNWCRLFFNPTFQKIEPLGFDFKGEQVKEIKPLKTFDANLFVVHLIDHSRMYSVRLYDLSNKSSSLNYKQLLVTPTTLTWSKEAVSSYGLILSSGLSICWRSSDGTMIYCSVFREDGSLMFNQTIVYRDSVIFSYVTAIPNGVVLFTTSRRYNEILQVVVITSDMHCLNGNCNSTYSMLESNESIKIKRRQYKSQDKAACYFVVGSKITTKSDDGSIEIRVLCDGLHKNFLSYHIFSVL